MQEHARGRRRHRPGAAGDRRRRGRDAADARAPRDLPAAAHQGRPRRAHQDRPGRARLARAGARGRARPARRHVPRAAARSCPCRSKTGAGPRRAAAALAEPGARAWRPSPSTRPRGCRRPRVHGQGLRHGGDGHACRGPVCGRRPGRGLSAGRRSPRCAACRCTAAPCRRADGRAAHRGEPAGDRARGHRARRRAGAARRARARRCSLDATVELLEDAPRPLKTRDRVRFHVGTQEVMARVLLVGRTALEPGGQAHGRLPARGARWWRCPATAS